MDMTTDFAERYKKMSNSELMEVLQNPSQYQSTALSIAKLEFASRQLSENEIQDAKQILLSQKVKKDKQDEKIEVAKTKVLDASNSFYDTINPIQTTAPTAEKLIRLITLVFTGLLIYKIAANSDLFYGLLKGDSHERFGYTLYLFPILVEIIAIILFWLRKQTGWILLATFCSYSLIDHLYGLYYSTTSQFRESIFSNFFRPPPPTAFIISILFYLGTLFVLKRLDIKEIYKIDKQRMQNSLILGTIIGVVFLFLQLSF